MNKTNLKDALAALKKQRLETTETAPTVHEKTHQAASAELDRLRLENSRLKAAQATAPAPTATASASPPMPTCLARFLAMEGAEKMTFFRENRSALKAAESHFRQDQAASARSASVQELRNRFPKSK